MNKSVKTEDAGRRSVYRGLRLNTAMVILRGLTFVAFLVMREYPMALVSLLGSLSYVCTRGSISKKPSLVFTLECVEIYVHMVAGIFFMGWDCCFQNLAFGTVPICFFSDYTLKKDHQEGFHAMVIAVVYLVTYLAARIFFTVVKPDYGHPAIEDDIIAFANSAIVLFMLLFYSYLYTHRTMEKEKELESIAVVDKLTGLYNRHMIAKVQEDLHIGHSGEEKVYALAILDIDNFKRVNDTYGHLAGDEILKRLADNLKTSKVDFVCRWGGEEFLILAVGEEAKDKLLKASEKVRAIMSISAAAYGEEFIKVTVSVGLAEFRTGEILQDTVERADKALYYAKTHGKNQVVVSGEESS